MLFRARQRGGYASLIDFQMLEPAGALMVVTAAFMAAFSGMVVAALVMLLMAVDSFAISGRDMLNAGGTTVVATVVHYIQACSCQ